MITPHLPSEALAAVLPARALVQNVTVSDSRVGWVSSGSGRSNSDILWSCLSILLVCTYKCIHFNVPSRVESEAGSVKRCGIYLPERLLWWKWLKKGGWIVTIVLAPEIGVAMAIDQYLLARECCKEQREDRKEHRINERKVAEDEDEVKDIGFGTKDIENGKKDGEVVEGDEE